MGKIFLKLAIRNLLKNKLHTGINIAGLAIGMASVILILLWIQNEISHDRFHEKIDRIYIANNRDKINGSLLAFNFTPKILGPTIKAEYPDVEDVVRVNPFGANFLLSVGDKHLSLRGAFADSGFLSLFSFPLLLGEKNTALTHPDGIVLTQQLAIKLFGNENAMGEIIRIDSVDNFVVTGVLKDLPPNTSFNFEYLLPWTYGTRTGMDDKNWGNNSILTYILLKPGASQEAFDAKIRDITINHNRNAAIKFTTQVFTQPLKDAWLYSDTENGKYVSGRIRKVRMFGIIAAFILVIACINFMNLSTARSEKRAKEVGIRKVVGAQKKSLIKQFISESILLAFLACILAVAMVQLFLPAYSQIVGSRLSIDFGNPFYWLFTGLFIFFTGLLAGSYPAFYLSAFKPVKVLKGSFKAAHAAVNPRKILVVLQFAFAIALIISTFIVQQQIKYAQRRDAGYSRDHLAFVIMFGDASKNYPLIKADLLSSGAATAVAATSAPLTERWNGSDGFSWDGSNSDDAKMEFDLFSVEEGFTKAFNLKIIEGRDIDVRSYSTDSTAVLLNETAVKKMRLTSPIGRTIKGGGCTLHVIGIVKDFIVETPYEPIPPMIIVGPMMAYDVINFKLNPGTPASVSLAKAEQVFKKYNPQYPFNCRFYDIEYAKKFEDEQRTEIFAGLFAGLTIFIACLGLFGLASYMAENRIKEIGVRKVLGASITGIVTLLSKDFLKLVVIAFIIASIIAGYAMHQWLMGYTYRVNLQWWVFAASGLLSVLIALFTISYHAIKSAVANPVENLRTE